MEEKTYIITLVNNQDENDTIEVESKGFGWGHAATKVERDMNFEYTGISAVELEVYLNNV